MVSYWAAIEVTDQPGVYEMLIQVNPDYRKKGVATAIARTAIEILKTKSARKIQAVIKATNSEVIALIYKIARLNNLKLTNQKDGTEVYYQIELN